jgi:hypothetical protein
MSRYRATARAVQVDPEVAEKGLNGTITIK